MERLRKRKPRKFRYYAAKYWNLAGTLIEDTMCADNYNEVYHFIYSQNFKPLSVKFDGWR